MSGVFLADVARAFDNSLQDAVRRRYTGQGYNFAADHAAAAAAYLCAVAAVEAFINEFFLSDLAVGMLAVKMPVPSEWVEKMNLGLKLILVPQLAVGRTLDRARAPYQDMDILISVRNELIHYKMGRPPKFVAALAQRSIVFRPVDDWGAWPDQISTTEGIRWAHNTASATNRALAELLPDGPPLSRAIADSFTTITEAHVRARLSALGVTSKP